MNEQQLPQFVKDYLVHLTKKGRQSSTIKRYTYDLMDFFHWLSVYKNTVSLTIWTELSREDIEQFFLYLMEERQYKVRTIRRIHSVLRQLATFYLKTKQHAIFLYEPPELELVPLQQSEWVTEKEARRLLSIIHSVQGLSEKQQEARPFFAGRNETIIRLFLDYGLSLQEVTRLTMNDVHFERNEVIIRSEKGEQLFSIEWKDEDKRCAYKYFKTIPEPVRPRFYSQDPFFVAFDFQRMTFRWSYENDQPKALTDIAIQKMLRLEVARAGLRKGISAQHLRNTFILRCLLNGESVQRIQEKLGLSTPLSLQRYLLTIKQLQNVGKTESWPY
ncbi:tyrosine-type recombinase/integrase [Halalkalibacter urbisdiaboli]|uniref:tyrosine-type recombinase/integrase n=1 Tax=Halalkalibacter urbisdiaboli TaxID=1960589 RepID=UPI000B4497E6|nr:phage integrase N-terminal SAM-like domain-containing protein [Halalkalibacter urbisdiaboli]